MRRKLAAARKLSPVEWRLLGEAWLGLLLAGRALRRHPLSRLQELRARRLARHPDRQKLRPGAVRPAELPTLVRLLEVARRHHPGPVRCLQRSLALQRLLDRRGIPSQLRIGVRLEEGRLFAHAWLEEGGVPLGEAPGGNGDVGGFLPLSGDLAA